ncbi:MAG: proton-conducting transporter membrane subunit [Anaeromicrobium sp.]|uniref:complex I subunit 5 family protein n=1 Tax=Anaeromicrobium sp. TaxID=1929132 RepID=UPI0025F9E09A|nr:proton-conducting transporter membrane subunit [Anaeromicrobium sp.]MCT4596239.1 proton-conducting transporter membrane subunit [Anaeromicrobium sp.]
MNVMRSSPLIIILLLFITAFCMPIMKKNKRVKILSGISLSLSLIFSVVNFINVLNNGPFSYRIGHYDSPWGISFYIGNVESIMGVVFTLVALLVMSYSYMTIEKEISKKRVNLYYTLMNLLLGSLLGIVFTNDLFNGFVFLEVSTLAGCGIIVIKDKKENIKATLKYLVLSSLGSGLVLMGIAFIYPVSGYLDMDFIGKSILSLEGGNRNLIVISASLFTIGLGVKSAMFPLHVWLPDAHSSAPSPSSAILSALVLKPPVLFLIKILYKVYKIQILKEMGILNILLVLGSIGMIGGSIFAMNQKEVKRVIAYSSVAQMGYIFYGIGLGSKLGVVMSIFHMIGHSLTKSALFLIGGSMIKKTGSKYVKDLKGIGREMPITLGLFTLCALSMVGIPILPGFISKWKLALATIESGKIYLIGIILLSSLLNVAYYFPIVINGYFGHENLEGKTYMSKELRKPKIIPMGILVICVILTGVFSIQIIDFISKGF